MPKRSAQRGRPPAVDTAGRPVRERILDAAGRLFYAEGIERVGIDRVLAEADAAKASLYQHFGSKAELVRSYLVAQVQAQRPPVEAMLADTALSPHDRLLSLFDYAAVCADQPGFRGCPFQNATCALTEADHPALDVLADQQAWLKRVIQQVVDESPALASQDQLAEALAALYNGAIMSAQVERSGAPCRAARWAAAGLLKSEYRSES